MVIDWGWFWFIAKPLFQALHWTNDHVAHNYGWSIVLVTIALNYASAAAAHQHEVDEEDAGASAADRRHQRKYKNISLRDPKKAEQNQEVMESIQEARVNPMGGCVPMLLQIPVLYRVL